MHYWRIPKNKGDGEMNILGLLERLSSHTVYRYGDSETECPECEWGQDNHEPNCELKAAIDGLKSGRLVVVNRMVTIESIKIKEQGE